MSVTGAAFPGDRAREPVGGEQLQVTVAVHILRKQLNQCQGWMATATWPNNHHHNQPLKNQYILLPVEVLHRQVQSTVLSFSQLVDIFHIVHIVHWTILNTPKTISSHPHSYHPQYSHEIPPTNFPQLSSAV